LSEAAVISDRRLEREAAKRRRARRGQAIAVGSSVLILGGLAALVLTSPGWPAVRETFFSWSIFKESFPEVLEGFWLDVKLFVIIEAAVLAIGLALALLKISRNPALFPLRLLATLFVDLFRGVPSILLIFLVGFGVPALELEGLPTDPVVLGAIASPSPTAATSPRSTEVGSARSTAVSARPPWRSASPRARRCGT